MNDRLEETVECPDPAAIFGAALSLWEACQRAAEKAPGLSLSQAYNGMDELMREVMRVGTLFETWACRHVAFAKLSEVWSYRLQDDFGAACLSLFEADSIEQFREVDCLRVAMQLRLPVFVSDSLPVAVDARVGNPSADSAFRTYRIQSMRHEVEQSDVTAFLPGDEPEDEDHGYPFFSLHGVKEDGMSEWIADRDTYAGAIWLLRNLVPGVILPPEPWVVELVPVR